MKYRSEIDGLRALAVLPVLFFHAGFEHFQGGYIGVDIFFVISGFLITNILIADLNSNKFSIMRFYERRARRILPALYLVVLLSIPFSIVLMLPADLLSYFESVIGVILFTSNFIFWGQSGYFDPAAELKPLLHTWSLAVEEQFYIFFPISLWLVWRFSRHFVTILLTLFVFASLLIAEWGWRNAYVPNFYLLPSRAWELLIGALCAHIVFKYNPCQNNRLAAFGLVVIIISFFVTNLNTPSPSIYILPPIIGVSLILLYGTEGTLTAKLLSFKPLVFIGLISYSLYLIHQPIFAFFRLSRLTQISDLERVYLIILSVILAYISWRFVERPFRDRKVIKLNIFVFLVFLFSSVLLLLSISYGNGKLIKSFSVSALGDSGVIPYDFDGLRQDQLHCTNREPKSACRFGDGGSDNIILIGDSHARVLTEAAYKLHIKNNFSFIDLSGCPYFPGLRLYTWKKEIEGCSVDLQAERTSVIANSAPSTVVMSSRFSLYLFGYGFDNGVGGIEARRNMQIGITGLEDFDQRLELIRKSLTSAIEEFVAAGHRVVLVGEAPGNGWDPMQRLMLLEYLHKSNTIDIDDLRKLMQIPKSFVDERQRELDEIFNKLAGTYQEVFFVDLKRIFCAKLHCQAISQKGEILYSDEDHLSSIAALKVFEKILAAETFY